MAQQQEGAADDFAALPVGELRARLARLHVSPSASILERADLVALLASAERKRRLGACAAAAAVLISSEMDGMRVPIACGCPTAEAVVRSCRFARAADDADGPLSLPRGGGLWGSQHPFSLNDGSDTNVGHLCISVYDWERRVVGFGARRRRHRRGRSRRGPPPPHEEAGQAEDEKEEEDVEEAVAAAEEAEVDLYVPRLEEGDLAAAICCACVVELSVLGDEFASALMPPNLLRVRRQDAEAGVRGLARRLSWPKVRLLFLGHRSCSADAVDVADHDRAAADRCSAASDGAAAAPTACDGVCPFTLLDLDLLRVIADCLVAAEIAATRREVAGVAVF